jgi:beta-mannosidase
VELVLMKDQHVIVARQKVPCSALARSQQTLHADAILNGFYDVTWSYRFGPPHHDVAIATLLDEGQQVVGEAHYFPVAREPAALSAASVQAEAVALPDGSLDVTLCTDRFLHAVSFDVQGFLPGDNYFHLSPLRPKQVRLTPTNRLGSRFNGFVEALNLSEPVKIAMQGSGNQPPSMKSDR